MLQNFGLNVIPQTVVIVMFQVDEVEVMNDC